MRPKFDLLHSALAFVVIAWWAKAEWYESGAEGFLVLSTILHLVGASCVIADAVLYVRASRAIAKKTAEEIRRTLNNIKA